MKKITHDLSKRITLTVFGILLCNFLFFGLYMLGQYSRGEAITAYSIEGVILNLALGVGAWFFIRYPMKKMDVQERRFAEDLRSGAVYETDYIWSDAQKAAIDRFQMIADRRQVMELSIESTKYMALQMQINPHFLYNTLDAIRSDMLIAGNERIADAVESLSKYFAYTISNADQMATIFEELENVQDYFRIQKYRFEDRMQLHIINDLMEQEIHEYSIPHLTLQPLVENAIVHGLETKSHCGTISIYLGRSEDSLMIRISDDGCGMDPDTLNRLNDQLQNPFRKPQARRKKRGGIALYNVNSRIKLLFGEEYGLRLFSMIDVGTDIVIRLPNKPRNVQ